MCNLAQTILIGLELNTKHQIRGENPMQRIKNFINDESGMETLEYAVIAGLIAAVAVLVYTSNWGTALQTRLLNATNAS
jgi:Flp pilus assembly pilin Flp